MEAIVRAGLCVGCGLCRSIAPNRVRIEMDMHGAEVPRVSEPLLPDELALINRVCPGLHAEGRAPERAAPAAEWDTVWGPALAMVKGHAGDPEIRFRGSAGGVLSALGIHLLESREVDFILHIRARGDLPMRAKAQVSTSAAAVMSGAGSRYAPAAPLTDFLALLERGRPFAVIAKPCDISAIDNLARSDGRVDRLVRYRLSFACGGLSSFAKSLELIQSYGLAEPEVSLLRFRGYGNPGRTRVETRDGRAFETTYNALWEDESKWRVLHRCKICGDALGEAADIAVTDVWPGGGPVGEDAGFNGIIARTERGLGLLERALAAGTLVEAGEMGFRDFDNVQPHQVRRKQALAARLEAVSDAGMPAPSYPRLRLEEAAATASAEFRRDNYEGMRARIAKRPLADPE